MTPSAALSWLRAHPRLAEALACVLCVGLGWAWHRPAAPKVEYREKVVTKTEWRDRVVEKRVEVAAKASDTQRVTHRVETTHPDGSKVVTLDTATGVETTVRVGQLATLNLTEQGAQTVARETTLVQTPQPLPRWRVGGLVGIGPAYGAEASMRVLGPIWFGAGGFVGPHPLGFASLGVEF